MLMGLSLRRAVIEVNPDALQIAESLDREREDGKVRSILHGIPFLVKDVRMNSLRLPARFFKFID